MPRKAELLKSLSRGRVRASMNKYNLFNLYKKRSADLMISPMNSFKQQWYAKQETRLYHGEHIREGRWKTDFDSKLKGVAQLDASLSGNQVDVPAPLMMQTYAVLEKRLDFAIFRAMFASSIRQARQFIIAKLVKVNGVVIRHPNFTLKPGDVFSVDPDHVLLLLGRKKPSLRESINIDNIQIAKWNKYVKEARDKPYATWLKKQSKHEQRQKDTSTQYEHHHKDEFEIEKQKEQDEKILQQMLARQRQTTRATVLRDIVITAKEHGSNLILNNFHPQFGTELSGKCIEVIKMLGGEKNAIYKAETLQDFEALLSTSTPEGQELKDDKSFSIRKVKQLINEIHSSYQNKLREDAEQLKVDASGVSRQYSANWANSLRRHRPVPTAEEIEEQGEQILAVSLPWQKGLFGRKDPVKKYFTPWQPRPFLSSLAILPHHIEINFETCHAIYLRDPVARPGASEVISPLSVDLHKRAYMWYLRHS